MNDQEPAQRPPPKPHKWRPQKDAKRCVECEAEFKRGDDVYDDVAVNIHVGCLASYRKTNRMLFGKGRL